MTGAQRKETSPQAVTTSIKSTILLPSVALMLALSCVFSPIVAQAAPAANSSTVVDAAAVQPFGSSPSFSLPPLNWIRTHLGTKSPYPHDSRPVGPLKDVPKGYELVQLQLVRKMKHFFFFRGRTYLFLCTSNSFTHRCLYISRNYWLYLLSYIKHSISYPIVFLLYSHHLPLPFVLSDLSPW